METDSARKVGGLQSGASTRSLVASANGVDATVLIQVVPIHGSLGPTLVWPQTVSRSVQPFCRAKLAL